MTFTLRAKNEASEGTVHAEWGSLTWLASKELTGSDVTLGRVVIKKGQSNPRHSHDNCEEVLYLLQGKLRHTMGPETVDMEVGDTLVVPAGVMHNAVNTGDTDADLIVAYSSGVRGFRKEFS